MFLFVLTASICYFIPPSGWEFAQSKNPSPHVQASFVGQGTSDFRPSVNLAFEEVDVPLKEYIKAVKQVHQSQPGVTWRDLGKFQLAEREGRLTEITSTSPLGELKMLQAITVLDNRAYILTAAMHKKDYQQLKASLLQSFHTLTFTPDLLSTLPREEIRSKIEHFYSDVSKNRPETELDAWQKKQWDHFQKLVLDECPEMGGHWQFLALKEGHARIYDKSEKTLR